MTNGTLSADITIRNQHGRTSTVRSLRKLRKSLDGCVGRIRSNRILVGIAVLSFLLNVYGIWWGLPYPSPPSWDHVGSNFRWTYDVIAPVSPLSVAYLMLTGGADARMLKQYPAFHYLVLFVFYAPYLLWLKLSGQLADPFPDYPYGFADPTTSLTVLAIIANLISAFMGVGIVICIYFIGKEIFDKRTGWLSALSAALGSTLIFYSHTSNVDVPYVFWSMLGILFYVRILKRQRWRDWTAFGVFSALAMSTKEQAYGLFGLLLPAMLWMHYRHLGSGPGSGLRKFVQGLFHRNLVVSGVAFLIVFIVANNLLFNLPAYIEHLRFIAGPGVAPYADFERSVTGYLGLLRLSVLFTQQSLGKPLFLLGVLGLVYCLVRFPKKTLILMLPSVSYCLLFLGVTMYVYIRFMLPVALLWCILVGKVLADLVSLPSRTLAKVPAALCLSIIMAYSVARAFAVDLVLINDSRILAGRWIEAHIPKGSTLLVYDRPRWLPYLSQDYQVQKALISIHQFTGCAEQEAEYIIFSERQYFMGVGVSESEAFQEAMQDSTFRSLYAGEMGYDLVADIKYRLPSWLDPHPSRTLNPRIFIFKLNAFCQTSS